MLLTHSTAAIIQLPKIPKESIEKPIIINKYNIKHIALLE